MDYLEDRPLHDEALEAIEMRRRRWDLVTLGLVAAAMLLSGHAVHEWLQQRGLASANSKVEGIVREVVLDIETKHAKIIHLNRAMTEKVTDELEVAAVVSSDDPSNKLQFVKTSDSSKANLDMSQLVEDERTEFDRLGELRAEFRAKQLELTALSVESKAVAKVLSELSGKVDFWKSKAIVHALNPEKAKGFQVSAVKKDDRYSSKGPRWVVNGFTQNDKKNLVDLRKKDVIVMLNGKTPGKTLAEFRNKWEYGDNGWVIIVYRGKT